MKQKSFKLIIFVPIYNCGEYIAECLQSIINQTYTKYEVIVYDDKSTDNSCDIINSIIHDKNNFILIKGENNLGPGHSKYFMCNYLLNNNYSDENIVIIIDGDDYLCDTSAFETIQSTYVNTKCWVAFGNFIVSPYISTFRGGDIPRPFNINKYIQEQGILSYPRTFKLWLLKHIFINNFKMDDNKWIMKMSDRCLMYQLFALCADKQIVHIDKIMCVYRLHDNSTPKRISNEIQIQSTNWVKLIKLPKKMGDINLI
jgi:glycosyltransferase involved in cell wall biosynthesis